MLVDEREIEIRMQIAALEFAVCEIITFIAKTQSPPAAREMLERIQLWPRAAAESPNPQGDPAMSDFVSAELENALRSLSERIAGHVRLPPK